VVDPDDEAPEDDEEGLDPDSFWGRALDFYDRYRKRLATLTIGVFVVAVAIEIGGAIPREVDVDYRFPAHASVVEATIEYSQESETVREVRLRWPDGAPRLVRDTLDLSPGDYDVDVWLVDREGDGRHLRGSVTAPADGVVRVRLRE